MSNLWYLKYRPTLVEDYNFKDAFLKAKVEEWIETKSIPNLLLSGPPGTGKTTLGLMLANHIAPEDFHLINASLNRGVDVVSNEIVNFCQTGGWNSIKIVMLDEFDNFTLDAQKMLRGIIETYGENVRFILTANYPQKIIAPLRDSRFTHVILDAMDWDEYLTKLITILVMEDVDIDIDDSTDVIETIAQQTYPDVRAAIGRLQLQTVSGRIVKTVDQPMKDWQLTLTDLVSSGASIGAVRDILIGLRKDELDQVYNFLWENSETLFGENESEAILIIANEEYKHTLRTYPEIGVASLIIQLQELKNSK